MKLSTALSIFAAIETCVSMPAFLKDLGFEEGRYNTIEKRDSNDRKYLIYVSQETCNIGTVRRDDIPGSAWSRCWGDTENDDSTFNCDLNFPYDLEADIVYRDYVDSTHKRIVWKGDGGNQDVMSAMIDVLMTIFDITVKSSEVDTQKSTGQTRCSAITGCETGYINVKSTQQQVPRLVAVKRFEGTAEAGSLAFRFDPAPTENDNWVDGVLDGLGFTIPKIQKIAKKLLPGSEGILGAFDLLKGASAKGKDPEWPF